MVSMNRIAVLLRGHIRTWEWTKQNQFVFFNSIADKVDYYVSVWNSSHPRFLSVTKLFDVFLTKNLVAREVRDNSWSYDAWTGPADMATRLTIERLYTELREQFKYDAIFDTRFDVAFELTGSPELPLTNSIGTTRVQLERDDLGWKGLEDHTFYSTGPISIVWNNRGLMKDPWTDAHTKLLDYANLNNITPYTVPWFKSIIVRPSIVEVTNSISVPGFSMVIPQVQSANHLWNIYSAADKLACLEKAQISPLEYCTALGFTY